MWVEITPVSQITEDYVLWDIRNKDPEEFEIRVCVFGAEGIPMMDVEGTSDVFFKASFD